jgi:hypothetical protein
MKLFAELPTQFTRKGKTFVRTKFTEEGVQKAGLHYRLVMVVDKSPRAKNYKANVYVFVLKSDR